MSNQKGRLDGKVAIITGGASGFGEGIAHRYAEEGARVLIADLNDEGGHRVVAELEAAHGKNIAAYVKTNVAKKDEVKNMVETCIQKFGRVDIMVNNAGVSHKNMPMLDIDDNMADMVWAVNVKAIWLSSLFVIPLFKNQGGGVIINTASTAALRPRPGLTLYNASKAAAVNLTKTMAVEFAPHNIRVNALCPVASDTPMLATFMGDDTPELRAKFIASVPLGRFSTPRDIANAALYFASDDASFITGVAMEIDGGRCV